MKKILDETIIDLAKSIAKSIIFNIIVRNIILINQGKIDLFQ
jgi:hypothetical protein